jgi:anion-transporting  ArsA/GET3 family ATPase
VPPPPGGPPLGERRLHFVLGKGGAGKSTVAAALGLAWARSGKRTLIVEVAGEDRLSDLFDTAGVAHERETELVPGLYGISIDAERATEEYLASQLRLRPLVELLTRSRAFHTFAAAAPGLAELVTLGKIWTLAIALRPAPARAGEAAREEPVWDAIVVDCPATGHGVALLETAGNVEDMAAGGPVRDQAARIHEVVSHPAATGISLVARPDELSVTEAVEAAGMLRERGLPVAAAVLNGVRDRRFSESDAPALEAAAAGPPGTERAAVAAALAHLARQRADARYRERLAAGVGLPVLELPEIVGRRFDLAALERLAAALGAAIGAHNGQP